MLGHVKGHLNFLFLSFFIHTDSINTFNPYILFGSNLTRYDVSRSDPKYIKIKIFYQKCPTSALNAETSL